MDGLDQFRSNQNVQQVGKTQLPWRQFLCKGKAQTIQNPLYIPYVWAATSIHELFDVHRVSWYVLTCFDTSHFWFSQVSWYVHHCAIFSILPASYIDRAFQLLKEPLHVPQLAGEMAIPLKSDLESPMGHRKMTCRLASFKVLCRFWGVHNYPSLSNRQSTSWWTSLQKQQKIQTRTVWSRKMNSQRDALEPPHSPTCHCLCQAAPEHDSVQILFQRLRQPCPPLLKRWVSSVRSVWSHPLSCKLTRVQLSHPNSWLFWIFPPLEKPVATKPRTGRWRQRIVLASSWQHGSGAFSSGLSILVRLVRFFRPRSSIRHAAFRKLILRWPGFHRLGALPQNCE